MHFEKFSSFVEEYSSKLSLSGMFVSTRDPRPVGSEVAFDLKLADGFRLVHGHGTVAWVRLQDGGPGRPAGMALRFVALDEKGRELVLKVLEEQLKAGGLPFEIDPPPADAILDYSGAPAPRQMPLPLQPGGDEEPTMITSRRRSLDETGFDAPWGQKLPEVPTDLLQDSVAEPSIPKVSEVHFAEPVPRKSGPPVAPEAAGAPRGLFAAAFPGQHPLGDSPGDLGFVLDEAPVGAPPAPAAEISWETPAAFGGALAPTEDPLIDFEPSPADIPFEPDPADLAMPSFDFGESSPQNSPAFFDEEEPTLMGSRQSVQPAVGMFDFGPPSTAPAAVPPPASTSAAVGGPSFDAAPAFDLPAFDAPVAEAPAFGTPAFAPPPAFEAPDFGAPAHAAPAYGEAFGEAFGAPVSAFPPPAFSPPPQSFPGPAPAAPPPGGLFDSWDPPAGQAGAAQRQVAAFEPMAPPMMPPADPAFAPPLAPPAPAVGYFDGSGVASPPDSAPYEEYSEWSEEPEQSRGARFKEALTSRKAIVGLAITAVLVTGAYFLAGDLLGGKEEEAIAGGPPPGRPPVATRPQPEPAPTPAPTLDTESGSPAPTENAASADGPENVAVRRDSFDTPAETPARAPDEIPSPAGDPAGSRSASRAEPSFRTGGSAHFMLRAEARPSAGETVVEMTFDGELDPGAIEHDSFTWTNDREKITFKGLDKPRQALLRVGSPQLKAVRFSWAPEGQTAVFDVPVGASIASVTPEGNRVRVVLVR